MPWILSKIRVVSIGLFICVLTPCFVFASSAAEKSPEAVIQLFYKALRGGRYAEARQYLSPERLRYPNRPPEYIPAVNWAAITAKQTKDATLQTVEVGEVTTFEEVREVAPRYVGGGSVMCSVLMRFADGSAQKSRIGLAKEGGVWKIYWIGEFEVEQYFRDYVVSIYRQNYFYSLSDFTQYFEILQGGRRVYMSGFGIGLSFFRLAQTDENRKRNNLFAMGKDITGNGVPNLVVVHHSGGSAGFATYYIFEIGQKFRKIAIIDDYLGIEFTDLDGDSKLEIVMHDNTFIYFLAVPATYRPPHVILRYQDGAYRIAIDLMHKPAPSREDLERRAQQAREDTHWKGWLEHGDVPESLYVPMLELLYSGHPDLAWEFLEMAWPPATSGKDAWLSKFRAELKESQYWPLNSKRAFFTIENYEKKVAAREEEIQRIKKQKEQKKQLGITD
jgi:hypothetical protein